MKIGSTTSKLHKSPADLIDAVSWSGTNAGGYTTVTYEEGVGKGATFTPTKGDTDKTLFFPNAGQRPVGGYSYFYGERGYFWIAAQSDTEGWYVRFDSSQTSGIVFTDPDRRANSLRCVRS